MTDTKDIEVLDDKTWQGICRVLDQVSLAMQGMVYLCKSTGAFDSEFKVISCALLE